MKGFILMLTFLTRIPIRYKFDFNSDDFIKGIKYMPLIGLIIGGILFPIRHFGDKLVPMILSLLIILVYLIVTGGLHLDGLADVSDGIFSYRDRDRIFEIMKDSRIGAFGVTALILYFMSMIVLLGYSNDVTILLFPVAGRCFALLVCSLNKYAKEKGMGKDFIDNTRISHVIGGFILLIILVSLFQKWLLLIATVITGIIVLLVSSSVNKKLDGITGDVIGMTVEFSQVVFLLSAYLLESLL
ncbi:adenosylcobinamide-GDP ribazoletransferase [Vallitalea longa]|uniref:Adenosylcobinamide-GDP ribazoletransferase n=1 Tax=Vallitalea longa TaxID=2936439 RepID=A0A9W6DI24_9FIRM|nr:adenosylcobinamide-GDP ribazoletransferase [Vallitalea longa]GKX32058.1 adenosylcobinamide-GDP ribazoletransferase [Vallitalea longa]